MNRTSLRLVFPLLLLVAAPCLFAQDFSPAQQEVWQLEETYWNDVKASNAEHYASLWHQAFLGWPRDRDRPIGKKELTAGAQKKMAEGRVASYEFLSKAVTAAGNVGVTQYSVKVTRTNKDGATDTYTSRVTHTWMRRGKIWEIIGGMSSPYESSGHTW